jgi:hypothetical protein
MTLIIPTGVLADARAKIVAALADKTEAERTKLDADMAVTFEEHSAYQTAQSRAHAMGRLPLETAQYIYAALGEVGSPANGGWAADTELADKVAITLFMPHLLKLGLAA